MLAVVAFVIAVQHALAYGRTAMFVIVPWYLGKAVGEAVKAGAWEAVLVIGVALVPVASWLHRTFMTWPSFMRRVHEGAGLDEVRELEERPEEPDDAAR